MSDDYAYDDDLTGEMFRSQPMERYKILIPGAKDPNVATAVMEALLKTKSLMIEDMNKQQFDQNRMYKSEEALALECTRKLKYLVNKTNEYLDGDTDGSRAEHVLGPAGSEPTHQEGQSLHAICDDLDEVTMNIKRNCSVISEVTAQMNKKREHRYVLDLCTKVLDAAIDGGSAGYDPHFGSGLSQEEDMGDGQPAIALLEGGGSPDMVRHICGVINTDRQERFRATLFRVMRSNVVTTIIPLGEALPDPTTGEKVQKSVFITFLTSPSMEEKARRLCDAFNCNMYDCPRMSADQHTAKIREEGLREGDIERLLTIIKSTEDGNVEFYWKVANNLAQWSGKIHAERTTFHALNKFVETHSEFLYAECWIPTKKMGAVEAALHLPIAGYGDNANAGTLERIETKKTKPTYFATNKYTGAFQGIVNAYGVARYQEANPTLFALSIFPFLFGVMFGDILHGSLLLIFSVLCIVYEKKLASVDNEMFVIPFGGRYLLFIMGISAIYMGFIYNEVASVPLDLFGSPYDAPDGMGALRLESAQYFNSTPYLVGMDPTWRWSSNNVQFTNSLKMKMAIVMGVTHMTLGVLLKACNMYYFGDWISLINESIPEILLFMSVFGYLIILIFVKWSTNWNVGDDCYGDWHTSGGTGNGTWFVDPACAALTDRVQWPRGPPMIITTLINFAFLGPVTHDSVLLFPDSCEPGPLGECSGQKYLQMFLLAIAGLSCPWLLLAKPFLLKKQMEEEQLPTGGHGADYESVGLTSDSPRGTDGDEAPPAKAPVEDDHDEHSFAEIFIHQVIHTIEYALGTVSNTASYLRLWALSLAHSQLSEVFWDMIFLGEKFKVGLNSAGSASTAMIVFCFLIWFGATIAVLMVMESLSAFLHALRLQWVEFQNKFYASDGFLFIADSYDDESAD